MTIKRQYDKDYYTSYNIGETNVDYLNSSEIRSLHEMVAKKLTEHFHPSTVLDAGCAMGILVSEFIKEGVQAYGLDFSAYAVTNADPLARDTCYCGALEEEFPETLPKWFDLVTCMEVVEHMTPEAGKRAISNLCKVTDTIIFCTTPDDFDDPTHINVQQREYWACCFAEHGFYDDLDYRPIFLTDYAVCYKRRKNWIDQVSQYEQYIRVTDAKLKNFRDTHYLALEAEHEKAVFEWTKTATELKDLHSEYCQLQYSYDQKEQQLHTTLESLEQLRCQCQELSEQARDLLQRKKDLEQSYSQCIAAQRLIQEQLVNSQKRIDALEQSTSWKITKPLRWTKYTLKRIVGKGSHILLQYSKKAKNATKRAKAVVIRQGCHWPPNICTSNSVTIPEQVSEKCVRLGIYTFYDADGIVDEYVVYYLKALRRWVERLVVVVNGSLQPEGTEKLMKLGCEILIRENSGFDAWGVKAGIEYLGFDVLHECDELLVSNNTLFGPVCDLTDMFQKMSQKKVDFWGIASHAGIQDWDPFGCNPYGYVPENVQSYFYAVRKRMLCGEAFRRFWTELPVLPNYDAAVGLYETVMTKYFSDAGYVWDTYMPSKIYYDMTDNPLITMPLEAIRDWNCPFFKRRAFFQDYDYLTTYTGQQSASCLMGYLQLHTDYPVKYIWDNLLRTCHLSDLVQNMHLSWILDRENRFIVENYTPTLRVALFMHIYDHTMAEILAGYAQALPPEADIFISTVSEEKKKWILEKFSLLPNRVEVRVLPNRGRDVSALLTSFRDVVMHYDVVCVTHDKKTEYLRPQTVGEGFAYMGYENILGSKFFVLQVLQTFSETEQLGMLYTPDPCHADFATHIGLEWGANFERTKSLAKELNLRVPIDEKHPPMAPFGSSFWFRTAAMKPLFAKAWCYEDFPEEPFQMTDGSILHAIERIYPYVVQHAGYYSGLLMTADYASVEIGNLTYYTRQYTHVCFENGIANRFVNVKNLCNLQMGTSISQLGKGKAYHIKSKIYNRLRQLKHRLSEWAKI